MGLIAKDKDFNASSREILMKVDLFFAGPSEDPLTVTSSDFLIDCSWLEESSADAAHPFGAISSNELNFRLFNDDGMFSPTNSSGPYYGEIKAGVLVIPYIRPGELFEWIKLGEYYVTGWEAEITGTYADVTANDRWHQIFSMSTPNYRIERNISHKLLLDNLFLLMNQSVEVSEQLTKTLLFSFIEGSPLNFLNEIITGAMAYCTCNKSGLPIVEPYIKERGTRAFLTDSDQIKVITAVQSIIRQYDGVDFTYSLPQISEQEKLADLQQLELDPGDTELLNIAFNKGPVWLLKYITINSDLDIVTLKDYNSTAWLLNIVLNNQHFEQLIGNIAAYGEYLTFTNITLADQEDNLLKVTNRYVQDSIYAMQYKQVLRNMVMNNIPTLTLSIRGNPLLNIGDRVTVLSGKYKLNYDGIIQRLRYDYAGGLSCEMTLLNNDTLLEVSP